MTFKIANKNIGQDFKPFIIAEMSGNHNQKIDLALQLVDAAADAGVDAIKLQTYTADSMTLDIKGGDFEIKDANSLWKGESLYSLYKKASTPWDWHPEIYKRASERGIICFSSPFDEKAVDFLEELDTPAYKIASFENNHIPLIKKVAETGKPILVSTGMASLSELERCVKTIRECGNEKILLLKCTSSYPASPKSSNIKTIPHLRNLFQCEVGLSDHTLGLGVPLASISLGACLIEKHFTLKRSDGGVDSAFSLEPEEFKSLVKESKTAWESLGEIKYGFTSSEKNSLIFKRSIYVIKDIKKGDKFNNDNIKVIRPGGGAPPYLYASILGKVAQKNFKRGQPLTFDTIIC